MGRFKRLASWALRAQQSAERWGISTMQERVRKKPPSYAVRVVDGSRFLSAGNIQVRSTRTAPPYYMVNTSVDPKTKAV
jgi:hypothetical protein